MEVGNSGMFRPEMLEPMGLPPDVRVIAWGLSLERPTMILYKIGNIRDLFGHRVRREPCRAGRGAASGVVVVQGGCGAGAGAADHDPVQYREHPGPAWGHRVRRREGE